MASAAESDSRIHPRGLRLMIVAVLTLVVVTLPLTSATQAAQRLNHSPCKGHGELDQPW
jgi:hypothetical protein